ncbi:MAG TPA: DUF1761 domain-containing protein [Thermoplasmata archaeon]|nr:DUF1761 domain-containing protein [Thermoplasmata archaeon]
MALMLSLTTGFVVSFVVATIVTMIIVMIWYARPVFGRRWMRALGRTEAQQQEGMKGQGKAIVAAFFTNLLLAAFLAWFLQELSITKALDGAIIGFLIWLGFVATTSAPSVFFEKRPAAVYAIDNACMFVSFIVMGALIPLVQSYIM